MNFFKKKRIIIPSVIVFLIWMQYIQTAELSPKMLKAFEVLNSMLGLIFFISIPLLIIVGYLFLIKYLIPNFTEAEIKAHENERKKDKNLKNNFHINKESKSLLEGLKKLKKLYKNGSLSKLEFEQAKEKVLK